MLFPFKKKNGVKNSGGGGGGCTFFIYFFRKTLLYHFISRFMIAIFNIKKKIEILKSSLSLTG